MVNVMTVLRDFQKLRMKDGDSVEKYVSIFRIYVFRLQGVFKMFIKDDEMVMRLLLFFSEFWLYFVILYTAV